MTIKVLLCYGKYCIKAAHYAAVFTSHQVTLGKEANCSYSRYLFFHNAGKFNLAMASLEKRMGLFVEFVFVTLVNFETDLCYTANIEAKI